MKSLKFLILTLFLLMSVSVFSQNIEKTVGNALITKDGGVAFKFTANTTILRGQLVAADTGTGYVKLADSTNILGVAYLNRNSNKDTVLAGSTLWVVVSGTAEVNILVADSAATNKYVCPSATAGMAHVLDYNVNAIHTVGWAVYRRGYSTSGRWFIKAKISIK